MKHNPADPHWPDRDRFVLSAGHASMLLYASLHLAGYDLSLDEIKQLPPARLEDARPPRELGTRRVSRRRPGRSARASRTASGWRWRSASCASASAPRSCDHHIFGICSDGDLMEGVASEAASLAGHLGLGRIVYLYDDNSITIDGSTDLAFSREDVEARFRAYGWHTQWVADGNDLEAIEAAIRAGMAEESTAVADPPDAR